MSPSLARNELNLLIEHYQFLIMNHSQFASNFNLEQPTLAIAKINLDNLIDIRNLLISQNYGGALELYNKIQLIGAQKNLVRDVIDYYKARPQTQYQIASEINLSLFINSTEIEKTYSSEIQEKFQLELTKISDVIKELSNKLISINDSSKSIESMSNQLNLYIENQSNFNTCQTKNTEEEAQLLKSLFENLKLELPEIVKKFEFDYEKINSHITTKLLSQLSSELFTPLNESLNKFIVVLHDELAKPTQDFKEGLLNLNARINFSIETYKRLDELSNIILNGTVDGVKEANSKIYPDLKNVVAESIKIELKAFFESVQRHVEASRKDGLSYQNNATKLLQEHQNKSRAITHYWAVFTVSLVIMAIVGTGYFTSKLTTKNTVSTILSLQKK